VPRSLNEVQSNEENAYWKEIGSRPKRWVYYAYPGLVFGFYLYFYSQAGTWQYYFSGAWTRQPGLIYTASIPSAPETASAARSPSSEAISMRSASRSQTGS
jgi:hypothetical protein